MLIEELCSTDRKNMTLFVKELVAAATVIFDERSRGSAETQAHLAYSIQGHGWYYLC